ncbi:MAG: LssY C-terminal domain-containing protein [Candidatus Methylomirabilales bacterium]
MFDQLLTLLLPSIEHFRIVGYWIAFFAALLESAPVAGMLVPGSVTVLFLGAIAARGYLDVGDLLWFAIVGAVMGDNVGYDVGKRFKHIFREEHRILNPKHLERARCFFEARGGKGVFLARFVPGLRENIPVVAGMAGMGRKRFFVANAIGAILWGFEHVFAGFLFGKSLQLAEMWLSRVGLVIGGLLIFLGVLYLLKRFVVRKGKYLLTLAWSMWQSIKDAIVGNPDVRALVNRHPFFFRFVADRLDKSKFSGLPLTVLSIAFVYALLLLAGVAEDVLTSDPIVAADMRVANLLVAFRSRELTTFFLWVTLLGKWQIVLSVATAACVLLWLWRQEIYIAPLLVASIGSEAFTQLGKIVFQRPRPPLAAYTEQSFSFPSGHATIAMAFYGFLAYLLIRNAKGWAVKVNTLFAGALAIILVGFSRLYLGVHYVSDVWGGYLVGAVWLILGITLTEWMRSKKSNSIPVQARAGARAVSVVIMIGVIGIYAGVGAQFQPALVGGHAGPTATVVSNVMDLFQNDQMKYTETIIGRHQEPLSVILITSDDQHLIDTFRKAGWHVADALNLSSFAKLVRAALLESNYPEAPITPSFWDARVHDLGFEKQTEAKKLAERHHARFWRTQFRTDDGRVIYVGTASMDRGIRWLVAHRIEPDIDGEREFLFGDLKRAGAVRTFSRKQFVKPALGQNFLGDPFFTDGKVYVIDLED